MSSEFYREFLKLDKSVVIMDNPYDKRTPKFFCPLLDGEEMRRLIYEKNGEARLAMSMNYILPPDLREKVDIALLSRDSQTVVYVFL